MKSKVLLMIRAAVSLALMAVLIYMVRGSIPKMLDAIKRLPLYIFLFGLCLFALSIFIASLRLQILLNTQSIFLPIANITRLTYIGYFFSSFLPTAVGGDVVKAFYVSKASNKAMHSYTTVFIDRLLGMTTIFLIGAGALFYTKEIPKTYLKWILPLLLIASGLFLLLLFNRGLVKKISPILAPLLPIKVKEKIKEIYDAMQNFEKQKLAIMKCIFVSIAGQITAFSAAYVFALGLHSYIPLKSVLVAMTVASIVGMLPSIYGTGPREMSIVIILGPLIGQDKALAVAFLWLGLLLAIALIGGIIYMFVGKFKTGPSNVPA